MWMFVISLLKNQPLPFCHVSFSITCQFFHVNGNQCCGSEIIIFGSGSGFNFGSGFGSGSGLLDKSYKTLPNLSSRKHHSKTLQPLQKMIIEHRPSRFYNLIFCIS